VSSDLELAERAARAAGEVLMSYFGRAAEGLDVKSSPTDPVSDADREAEATIQTIISSARPGDGIIGEEGAQSSAANGRTWIVDPLDGTVNFLYGMRAWAVSIALEEAQGVSAAVVFNPVDDECFAAARGEGATMNGRPIQASGCESLDRAMVGTGFSYEAERRAEQAELLVRLLPAVRDVRRAGAAALDLAYLACGRIDAFYERGLKRWDEAAGRLLVEEAGGTCRDLDGGWPGVVAAATRPLLADLAELVG
jgi:myo-inositol-1(or 4)-monophosphatase